MRVAKAISNLTEAFERLPGVGPKTAQRLTYYLLHVPQGELDKFAEALKALKANTLECDNCHNIADTNPCDICSDIGRDQTLICVVEQPLDVLAIERGRGFNGIYHVLHGVIDPLHNIGPDEIRINSLMTKAQSSNPKIREIILALNPNMEGEATALYIKREITNNKTQISNEIKITRLAQGLAIGADIEYADEVTLSRAMQGRTEY